MRTFLLLIIAAALAAVPLNVRADGDECCTTDELEVLSTGLKEDIMGNQVLTGFIVNRSKHLGYEDVHIIADLYNENLEYIGSEEFHLDEDVELKETEDFRVHLRTGRDIACVKYTVNCAELD